MGILSDFNKGWIMSSPKWYSPEKQPLWDAIIITGTGEKLLWRSWDSAAPGWWERIVEEKQIKKWRKVNDKDNLSRFKRATL